MATQESITSICSMAGLDAAQTARVLAAAEETGLLLPAPTVSVAWPAGLEPHTGRPPKNAPEAALYRLLTAAGWSVSKRGWPDFFCTRGNEVMAVEVKPHGAQLLRNTQAAVMFSLAAHGFACFRWDPSSGFEAFSTPGPGVHAQVSTRALHTTSRILQDNHLVGPGEKLADSPVKFARAPRKTQWPADLSLTSELAAYAMDKLWKGVETPAPEAVRALWEHFEAYHRARGSGFADWSRAWHTWVLKAAQFRESDAKRGAPREHELDLAAGYVDRARRLDEAGAGKRARGAHGRKLEPAGVVERQIRLIR